MTNPIKLRSCIGKTFVSGDCKITVIAITADSVCYRIHPMDKTYYNRHKTFERWLAGAVEVEDKT